MAVDEEEEEDGGETDEDDDDLGDEEEEVDEEYSGVKNDEMIAAPRRRWCGRNSMSGHQPPRVD